MVLHEIKHFEAADPARARLGGTPLAPMELSFVILTTTRPGDVNYRATKMRQPVFYLGGRL